jgi:hypothetical protein
MKLAHGIVDTMEVACGACQIAQKVCHRKQNLININKRNICRSTGQTGHIIITMIYLFNCKWDVPWWQWLICIYINVK